MKTISVTKNDIDVADALRGTANFNITTSCPVAIALQRIFKTEDANWAWASGDVNGTWYRAQDQVTVENIVMNWDNKRGMKPFKFVLVPDSEYNY